MGGGIGGGRLSGVCRQPQGGGPLPRALWGGSGAKSDAADAKVLADLVRTDRHNHRLVAGDSEAGQGIKVLARAHQRLVWSCQRQVNSLRSLLREFYPAALAAFDDLDHSDALAVLGRAPTPGAGRRLSRSTIAATLRRGGRQRHVDNRAAQIHAALRAPQPQPPRRRWPAPTGPPWPPAVGVITEMTPTAGIPRGRTRTGF